jgi:C4-type Zn-finger protein
MQNIMRIKPTWCSRCDTMLEVIEPIDDEPKFGTVPLNVTVCDCCGHLMMVESNLTLREPTTDELRNLTNHPIVVAEQRRSIN